MARAAQPVARCVEHSRQPWCVQIPDSASGWPSARGTNPISGPCSKGCITPSATTSELAATACQLPSMGTISPLDAFHAAARNATPVA
jgi:hypothetical protein